MSHHALLLGCSIAVIVLLAAGIIIGTRLTTERYDYSGDTNDAEALARAPPSSTPR